MTLKFNERDSTFLWMSDDADRANNAGLTLSKSIRSSKGEKVWFTGDYNGQPVNNPYAALEFWDEADESARQRLFNMHQDYKASWADDSPEHFPSPEGLEYLPYQRAGIAYAMGKKNCLIGDEPGLGKTVQAIGVSNAMEAKKSLVVCPASIRLNWQREIRKWSTLRRVSTYPVLKASDGVSPATDYTIISYDLLRNPGIHAALLDIDWDLMVLDEAHYLKTVDAKRTRAVFGGGTSIFKESYLAEKANKIVALTGTPLPNRPRECYTLARALDWESIDWMSQEMFEYRFNPSGRMDSGKSLEKTGRLPELHARLRSNFMVRRKKEDVLKDLPDKRYELSYVEPNGAIKAVLAKEKFIDFDPQSLFNPDFGIDGEIATVRREMGEAMAPRVVEHVKYLLDIVELPKIVIFAHHKSVMDELADSLDKYGIVSVRGGMSNQAKQRNIDAFSMNPDIRLFQGQLDTMEGIDGLQQTAFYAVFAEPAWTPGRNEQCVDRLHRMGQHGNVIGQFMVAEGSFNEKVLKGVMVKSHNIHDTLDRNPFDM